MTEFNDTQIRVPMIALRGLVIVPRMIVHFDVGRKRSVAALNAAVKSNTPVFLVSQKDMMVDDPGIDDIYRYGTLSTVKQVLKLSGDNIRVMVEGEARARVVEILPGRHFNQAVIERLPETPSTDLTAAQAAVREIRAAFEEYISYAPKISPDTMMAVITAEEPGELADFIIANLNLSHELKQKVLEAHDPIDRAKTLVAVLYNEVEILKIENSIHEQVKGQLDQNQREYYLREQMKVIQEELGEGESLTDEVQNYRNKIADLKLSKEIEEPLLKEVAKLAKMGGSATEATVIRGYLDACLDLPWNTKTKDKLDIARVKARLDKDHYGLVKVKERILEYIAVRKLTDGKNSQVLCLVGPPGVGKTSIATSIAGAMGRKFARISLGGIRDEAEIRGHRKTYIGAMPGRIIAAIRQAGSANPLILLDEIDKLTSDVRGDPAAALLEVLDTEQNKTFRDHYIELPFDLRDVMFITTANNMDTIPLPLRDRMEIIELTSYTNSEKLHIAQDFLVPRQIKKNGLTKRDIRFTPEGLAAIIDCYTRESGVRTLEREIAACCRKAATAKVSGDGKVFTITPENLDALLGPPRFKREDVPHTDEVGLCNGLAWTSVGGEILQIEVSVVEGTGKVQLTGSLGDIMKESCNAAITYVRSRCSELGIDGEFYKNSDIHIHFPEGAVPKDGPSAGIAITTALVSALTGSPVRGDIAMTGEVTLRGRVLPIGGLKEKTMAAYREGLLTVILPSENRPDIEEIDTEVAKALNFIYVKNADEVIEIALRSKVLKALTEPFISAAVAPPAIRISQ
ncbi:Lon protease 1 [bioreactor metagenome]|uniref:endopeptidase La n=1 Tax=bioreactor metagenome TaxID=1076179 RepID=A0A644X0U0_9ZZZZ